MVTHNNDFRLTALEEGKYSLEDKNAEQKEGKENTKTVATIIEAIGPDLKRNYDQERNHTEEHTIEVLVGDPVIPHHICRNRQIGKYPIHLKDRHQLATSHT